MNEAAEMFVSAGAVKAQRLSALSVRGISFSVPHNKFQQSPAWTFSLTLSFSPKWDKTLEVCPPPPLCVCVCVCVCVWESQSSHHIQVLVSHSAMSLPVNMWSIQEVKCSNEFVKRLPRGVFGISAANCFSSLLIVISHFYGCRVSLRAAGLVDSAVVPVLPCCFTSGMFWYLLW